MMSMKGLAMVQERAPKPTRQGHAEPTGELGRLIEAWMDSQRFRPSQRELAKELKVSPQLVSNWVRGNYKGMLKPVDVGRLARMMVRPGQSEWDMRKEILEAILRDTDQVPPGKRLF